MKDVTHVCLCPGEEYLLAVDYSGGRPAVTRVPTLEIVPMLSPFLAKKTVPVFEIIKGGKEATVEKPEFPYVPIEY